MKKTQSLYHFDNNYASSPMDLGEISLIQIGRRFCCAGERIMPHTHRDWFELTIAIGGDARVGAGSGYVGVSRGDIYISFPCDIHEIVAGEDGFEYDYFSFVCKEEGTLYERLTEISDLSRLGDTGEHRVFRDERVEFLVKCAINELSSPSYGSDTLVSGFLREAVIYTARTARDIGRITGEPQHAPRADLTCYRMMNYIDTHIYSMTSLEELADQFNYNYSYLSSLFHRTTGKTLREYYSERRLELARTMVLENDLKIWEIADMLHYSSAFAFSKAFVQKYGISPKKMQMSKEN